jgi:hypothetical protein
MAQGWLRCRQYVDATCPTGLPRDAMAMDGWNQRLRELATPRANLRFIDPFAALCDDRQCRATRGDTALYWDAQHLTTPGAERVLAPLRAAEAAIPPAR